MLHRSGVAWQALAESCSQFLKKGSAVLVEGEPKSRLKENEDGTKRSFVEIKALHVQFLDKETDSATLGEEGNFFNQSQKEKLTGLESLW